MLSINIDAFKKNMNSFINQVIDHSEIIIINKNEKNVVIISQDDYNLLTANYKNQDTYTFNDEELKKIKKALIDIDNNRVFSAEEEKKIMEEWFKNIAN
jgi:PHD/YefM family antitoxin component YafN of YafNO toxin-antitoxin module